MPDDGGNCYILENYEDKTMQNQQNVPLHTACGCVIIKLNH